MTKVGSQEWRNNVFTYPIAVLSTRCGIRAPGHSAAVVSRFMRFNHGFPWCDGHMSYETRAEAAAAAYEEWYAEATSNMPGGRDHD